MTLDIIKSIILGVVEGLTEFLPVSSTGHLILLNQWISFTEPFTQMFDIVIQLGAILAVVVYFWKRFWPISNLWLKILAGVIPALILGALFGDVIEEKLFNPYVVATALIIGGLILIFIENKKIKHRFETVKELPWQTAVYIGLFQCLAMIPGTSRAAATIIGAMVLGASRSVAVEFSFFLAIPTMVAASGYSLLKHGAAISSNEIIILAIGFITAFATALAVIKFFMDYIQRHNFKPFGYYRLALGALVLIYFLLK